MPTPASHFLRLFESKRFQHSVRTKKFDKSLDQLPLRVKNDARKTYGQWRKDPSSVDFRPLQGNKSIWRISLPDGYRAIGEDLGDTIKWFWIGSHNDYENIIRSI